MYILYILCILYTPSLGPQSAAATRVLPGAPPAPPPFFFHQQVRSVFTIVDFQDADSLHACMLVIILPPGLGEIPGCTPGGVSFTVLEGVVTSQ